MEEYVSGPLLVMRRLKLRSNLLKTKLRKLHNDSYDNDTVPNYDAYEYFVYDGSGFRELKYYFRDIEPLMADRKGELERFVRLNNLNIRNTPAQLVVLQHYNQLKSQDQITASAQSEMK